MKKTFLALLMAGGALTVVAQTTGTNQTTTNQTMGTTTNTMGTTNNINTWNGVSANSTSWTPDRDPSWGWNNYGVWNGSANWNANSNNPYGNNTTAYGTSGTNTNMSGNTMNNNMNGNTNWNNQNGTAMNADGSMNSTRSYSAYGTAVPYLPQNVQMRFNEDHPMSVNNTYSWNQYGDWFHTYHNNNGRLMQYFYDSRGSGYALALPVLQTYVPENIINSALNKYGSNLYSIGMVKTNNGNSTYQIGLIDRGQISMHYLDENGVTVNDVWRTENMNSGSMTSTQSNAAMGADGHMNHQNMQHHNSSMMNDQGQSKEVKDAKIKLEYADGTETKIKTEKGKTKVKHDHK